jgi:hypothetical protein
MAAFRSLARAFSVLPSSNPQQESKNSSPTYSRAAEAEVLLICARAGVSCIGITADRVLFQPTVTSISIPLAEFQDHERAAAQKL